MIPIATKDRAHAGDQIARPLTDEAAFQLGRQIGPDFGVDPVVDILGHVHLWPRREVSTLDEIRVLRIVLGVTDARVEWHPWRPAAADIVWAAS